MKYSIDSQKKAEITIKAAMVLKQHCKKMVAVYLFGSFVTDEPFSDIDIGILLRESNRKTLNAELELESQMEKIIKYQVDVRILNTAPLSFVRNVIKNGRLIVDINPTFRSDFESLTARKYFDFSRFRKRYLEDVCNAPI